MRQYHRWLSVLFGIFLLWIAITGVLSQVAPMVNRGSIFEQEKKPPRPAQAASLGGVILAAQAHDEAEEAAEAAAKAKGAGPTTSAPAPFVCPADMNCRPKQKPGAWNVGFIHDLHSGETFGPVGTIISLLSGVAMIFFAFSGLWMYIQMFRRRGNRPGQAKWFW